MLLRITVLRSRCIGSVVAAIDHYLAFTPNSDCASRTLVAVQTVTSVTVILVVFFHFKTTKCAETRDLTHLYALHSLATRQHKKTKTKTKCPGDREKAGAG